MKRRNFIKNSAALAIIGSASVKDLDIFTDQKLGNERLFLQEPGPMLPPVPAILLTVNGKENEPDEISVVWTFILNGKPPQIGISVADEHRALDLIKIHKEFVLNLPVASIVEKFDKVDMNSSKVMDKYKLSGLTRGKASIINAPTIKEAPIQCECKVINELRLPPDRTFFVAEVVATSYLAGACDENGRLIVENVPFFGMTAGSGEFYTMGKKVGHIGKTVGRTDIKY